MPLENIGQKLKAAREAQGLSLIQVFERTKIPLNHLQSIEGGRAEDLPETVYVSGFIKRYAECVGLDGQVLSDDYRLHLEEHRGKKKGKQQNSPSQNYISSDYIPRSKVQVSTPFYKLWLFNGIIMLCVVGTIVWFINTQANNIANQPDPSLISLRESTSRLNPGAVPTAQPAQQNSPDKAAVPQELSQKITLSALRHVWVEVKKVSSGENAYTGFMEQGDRRDFEDSQGLIIRAGDGGGLSVERQGKIEPFGLSGHVTEKTFSAPAPVATASTPGEKAPVVSTAGTTTTNTVAAVKPVKRVVRRAPDAEGGSSRGYRRIDEGPSRQYVPGESLGGTRSIDVPYRYSEGRLDSD